MPFLPPVSIVRSVSGLTGKESNSSSASNKVSKDGSSVKERISLKHLKHLGKKTEKNTDVVEAQPSPSQGSVKAGSEVKSRVRGQEEACFTLTLTPEAVLLLQKRNSERHQKANKSAAANCGGATETRNNGRRRENPSKRPQNPQRRTKMAAEPDLDICSILKISLLNEHHKYDDVEYEEEEERCAVDQRVVLKCTEWLRGLESPLTGASVTGTRTGKSC